MNGTRRTIAAFVALVLLGYPLPSRAGESKIPIRQSLAAYKARALLVRADLAGGAALTGHIGRIRSSTFDLIDGTGQEAEQVRYADLTTITDAATGERLLLVNRQASFSSGSRRSFGLKALIVIGVAVGVFLAVSYLHGDLAS